jgi:hypothetical protein
MYPPQCVDCSRFVAVKDPDTRRLPEYGEFGTLLNTEFQCGKCYRAWKDNAPASVPGDGERPGR